MDQVGIQKALVSPLRALFYQDCGPANRELASSLRPHKDRLLPVPAINPNFPGWRKELGRCLEEMQPRAIKLHPNYHGYDLTAEEPMALLQTCAECGLPVLVALRMQDERLHHPAMMVPPVGVDQMIAAADLVPGAKLVACMARLTEGEALLRHPRLMVELSGMQGPTGFVDRLVAEFGSRRILFGSGLPLQYPLPGVAKIQVADVSQHDKDNILQGNTEELLEVS